MDLDARRLGQQENGDSLVARNGRLAPGDPVRMHVFRHDPDQTANGRYELFVVPYVARMRLLDALNAVADDGASDLAYRWLCGSKMCGTCAVRMNGREVLACWEAVEPEMMIEPLRNLPLIRDLVVDRTPYENRVAALQPWLARVEPYSGFPEALSGAAMGNASKALDCISCMSCYSACPVVGLGALTDFAGPAPLVQLAQTALDPRQDLVQAGQSIECAGVFGCISCYRCEEVCPAGIPIVTGIIEPLQAMAAKSGVQAAQHARVFRSIVARRGRIDPAELVLRVQGVRALKGIRRIVMLLLRGKVSLWRLLDIRSTGAAKAARRMLHEVR